MLLYLPLALLHLYLKNQTKKLPALPGLVAGPGLSAPIGRKSESPIPLLSLTRKARAALGLKSGQRRPRIKACAPKVKVKSPASGFNLAYFARLKPPLKRLNGGPASGPSKDLIYPPGPCTYPQIHQGAPGPSRRRVPAQVQGPGPAAGFAGCPWFESRSG